METMNKENELKLWSFVNENYEMSWRKKRATEYSEEVEYKKSRRKVMIFTIVVIAIGILLMGAMVVKAMTTENGYYIKTETRQADGSYYVYVTEKNCTVIDTDTTKGLVTVDYKGTAYSFYGDGYEKGDKVVCKFTNDMKIVGTVK